MNKVTALIRANKILSKVQAGLTFGSLLAPKNIDIIHGLSDVAAKCVTAMQLIPNIEITRELRKTSNKIVSLGESLHDEAVNKTEALKICSDISVDIKKLRKILADFTKEKILAAEVAAFNVEAASFVPSGKLLKNFSELKELADLLKSNEDNAKIVLKNESEPEPELELEQEKIEQDPDIDIRKYSDRLDSEAMRIKALLLQAAEHLPSKSDIAKGLRKDTIVLVKAPILTVTKPFLADTKLRSARFTNYVRLSMSHGVSQPIIGDSTNIGVIILDQFVLAINAGQLNSKDLKSQIERRLEVISNRVGKVVPVYIGINPKKILDNSKIDKLDSDASGVDAKSRQKQIKDIRKNEEKQLSATSRSLFFRDSGYPNVLFMWIMSETQFSKLSPVQFTAVTFPNADQNYATPNIEKIQRDSDNNLALEKSKIDRLRQERLEKEDENKSALQTSILTVEQKTKKLRNQNNKINDEVIAIQRELEREANLIAAMTSQLEAQAREFNSMMPKDKNKTALATQIAATKAAVDAKSHEIDNIRKTKLASFVKQAKEIKDKIRVIIDDERKRLGLSKVARTELKAYK